MKILDRYLLKRFCWLLVATVVACQTAFVVIDLIGNLDRYLGVSARYVFLYYFYLLPYITVVIFPIAMLLASMFTTGVLSRNNEISAMLAAGIGLRRISAPLFAASLLICMAILAFSETVLPEFHKRKSDLSNFEMKKRPRQTNLAKHNFYYQGRNGVIYRIGKYSNGASTAHNVMLEQYQDNRMQWRARADSMVWQNEEWMLHNGVRMDFAGPLLQSTRFSDWAPPKLVDKPEDFVVDQKSPDDMNFFELRRYIDQVRRSGGKAERYLADLHFKISYPLINLIVVLLGVSLTVRIGKGGLAPVFGVGIVTCFTYYLLAKFGLAFGHSESLPPLFAAWLGNIVFFGVGTILFARASR